MMAFECLKKKSFPFGGSGQPGEETNCYFFGVILRNDATRSLLVCVKLVLKEYHRNRKGPLPLIPRPFFFKMSQKNSRVWYWEGANQPTYTVSVYRINIRRYNICIQMVIKTLIISMLMNLRLMMDWVCVTLDVSRTLVISKCYSAEEN